MDFYSRITQLCEDRKISLRQLGLKLGLASASIYKWKKHYPKGAELIKIARYFNVSTDYLLGLDNLIMDNNIPIRNNKTTIIDRISDIAEKQGFNLGQLAKSTGFAPSTIYKWKTQNPKGSDLAKVAQFLGVSTDYLLGLEKETMPELKAKDLVELTDTEIDTLQISSNLGFSLSNKDLHMLQTLLKAYVYERKNDSN